MPTLSRIGPNGTPETLRLSPDQVVKVVSGLFAILRKGRIDRLLKPGQCFLVDPQHDDDALLCLEDGDVSLSTPGPSSNARARRMAEQLEALSEERRILQRGLADAIGPRGEIPGGPYDSDACELVLLVVEDPAVVSAIPRTLHHVPGVMPRYLLAFCNYRGFGGDRVDASGHSKRVNLSYRETTLLVPVAHAGAGPGLYIPEIYPDSMMAVLAGREVFGFPKRYAETWYEPSSAGCVVDGKLAAQVSYGTGQALSSEEMAKEIFSTLLTGTGGPGLPGPLTGGWLTDIAIEAVDTLPILVRRREAEFRKSRAWTQHDLVAIPFRINAPRGCERLNLNAWHLDHHRWRGGTVIAGWRFTVGMEIDVAYPVGDLRPGLRGKALDTRRRGSALLRRSWEIAKSLITPADPMTPPMPPVVHTPVPNGAYPLGPGAPTPLIVGPGQVAEVHSGLVAAFEGEAFLKVLQPGDHWGHWTRWLSSTQPGVGQIGLRAVTPAQVLVKPVPSNPSVGELLPELMLAEALHTQLEQRVAWRFEGDLAASDERKPYVGRVVNQCWELDLPAGFVPPPLPPGFLRIPGTRPVLVHQRHEHLGPVGSEARLDFEQVGIWIPVLRPGQPWGFLLIRTWQNTLTALQVSRDLGSYNTRYGDLEAIDHPTRGPCWALFAEGRLLAMAPDLEQQSGTLRPIPGGAWLREQVKRPTLPMHGYAWKVSPAGAFEGSGERIHRASARIRRLEVSLGPSPQPITVEIPKLAGATSRRAWLIKASVLMKPARRIGLKRFIGR